MVDLGQLLRLKQTIDAAAAVQATPESADALVGSYNRLLANVRQLAVDASLETEFDGLFTPVAASAPLSPGLVGRSMLQNRSAAEVAAASASAMLAQLAGWVDGLIAEQTLEARIKAEAQARVAAEQKPPTGFART